MIEIYIYEKTGGFAENKDIAKEIRTTKIIPALELNQKIVIDFDKVDSATQSFIHAMISSVIRSKGISVLDKISFRNCNETIKKIINIVVEYMQESA